MKNSTTARIIRHSLSATVLCTPSVALAHAGHLGELAGHSHWLGVAALAGAVAIAGLVTIKGRKKEAVSEEPETAAETDKGTETAQ